MIEDRFITLTLTNNCNLNCSYCYEHNKSNLVMSFQTAKSIIDNELSNPIEGRFHISLFGGEPFIEFNLIKKIVAYLRATYDKSKFYISITTNGTLIHGDIQQWASNNKDIVTLALSIDGTRSMHNKNRCNSFDLIDVPFFVKHFPNQKIKMTISQQTLPDLFDGVRFCESLGFKVYCNLAHGIDWSCKKNLEDLDNQLFLLSAYYLENPSQEVCSILADGISQIAVNNQNDFVYKWCSTGNEMVAYDPNGRAYPCQFFMPLSCGEEKAEKSTKIHFCDKISITLLDSKCQNCIIKHACPTCYGANFTKFGNIYQKDDNYCKLTKRIILARSYFWANKWTRGQLNLSMAEEQALLKSIVLIQENLTL